MQAGTVRPLAILGASGFGKEVAWIVERLNGVSPSFEIVGFCDDAEGKREGVFAGYPLLGPLEVAAARWPGVGFHCAVGDNRARQALTARALAAGWAPVTLIDCAAVVAPGAAVGLGSYIGIGGVVSVGATVGRGVIINHQVTVGHDVTVGDFAQLCPGVRVSGGCELGEGVLLGSNACTIPGVKVGSWSTVGAGAAALRDIPAGGGVLRMSR
jgi:sugar O-acyltransferase (sialic acid O-acetyltransferase NeuD family)